MACWTALPAKAQGEVITLSGGELSYACVREKYSGSIFDVTLRLRRDCLLEEEFDSTAKVMIFKVLPDECRYTVASWVKLKLVNRRKVSVSPEACTNLCDSICVEEAIYREEVGLPPCPGGYVLAYQRCCRDEKLDNILDPGLSGGTWWVHISEEAAKACNSSPRFPGWSNRIMCLNTPYQIDFSATDHDGDSLVYRLYSPSVGADLESPLPKFITRPPYDSVQFVSPYSGDDLIGGTVPFRIDPVTGIITVTPQIRGQFLIGVAVDEWRNGLLIGTVRTDFQIDVCGGLDTCRAPRDSLFVCKGETVQIIDLLEDFVPSVGCKYIWEPMEGLIFAKDDTLNTNPKWIAEETTLFTVIAANSEFADTGYVYFQVVPGPRITLPDTAFVQCLNTDCITVRADSSFDYQWDPRPEVSTERDSLVFMFCPPEVNRYYRVTVTSAKFGNLTNAQDFCTLVDSFYVTADPVIQLLPDTICPGDTSEYLLQDRVACWTYQWAPLESLIFSDSLVMAAPSTTTTYRVTVTNGTEVAEDSVTVVVLPPDSVTVEVLMAPFICDGRATLTGHTTGSTFHTTFLWSFSPDFSVIESMEDTFHLETQLDTLTVYLTAAPQSGSAGAFCGADTTSIQLVNKTIGLKATYSAIDTCFTDTTSVLIIDTLKGIPVNSIVWSTADQRNWVDPDNLTANPIRVRANPGQREIVLYYQTTFEGSCNVRDSLIVDITGAWTFSLETEQNFCGDTTILTIRELPEQDNASFTWYNGVPGEEGSQILGTGKSLTVTGDIIPVIFVTGEAFWCRDTMMALIDVPPKLGSVQVTPSRLCPGDTALVVLSPLTGHSLSTFWKTNGLVVDSTDTFLMVVALTSIDSLRISYTSSSVTCPNLTCDSMLVLPLDTVASPNPLWTKIPCTYQAIISVDTTMYQDGDIQWVIPALGDTSMATIDTLSFPGPGSYTVTLMPGPDLLSCLFTPDSLTMVIPEFIRLKPVSDTLIFICANPMTPEDSMYRLSVMPSIDEIHITWINLDGDTLGMGLEILVNPYAEDTIVYAISDADSCDCRDTVRFYLPVSGCRFLIAGQAGDYCAQKDFTGPSAYMFCDGDTITEVIYDWQPSDFIVDGQNSPAPVFNAPATFEATITILDTIRNCAYDTTFFIEIFEKPSVIIDVDPEKVLVGLKTTLTAIPGTTDPYAYKWDTDETTQAITVMPPEGGVTYRVTITDAHGCCDSSSVIVDPIPCKYGIPTAFSPNDDGINDFFKVRSSCPLVDFELKIINRWGQEVFATTDQENGWDGTMNGRKCPPDVFAYCVILRCPNKEEKETILGDVSLVR